MKKIFTLLLAVVSMQVLAQETNTNEDTKLGLTKRENLDPWTYKQGTRPKKGDLGFFVAAGTQDLANINAINPLSYLNFRYYYKNDLVFRLGVSLYKSKTVNNGTDEFTGGSISGISKSVAKTSDREYYIRPGVEKHFALTNLIDVYVAADVLLGFRRYNYDSRATSGNSEFGLYSSRRSIDYGLGTYIGFQAFVADLPLSIGAEVGFQGLGSLWHRTKVVEYVGTSTNEYYLPVDANFNTDATATPYQELDGRRFDLNTNLKLIISYYFSRK